jgi:NarL family two-component system response regulator LiaR
MIKLLIVDDHPALRWGLVGLFTHESDFEVVGEASDGIEAIEKSISLKPNIILMDLALPKKSGLEEIKEIILIQPEMKILIFSAFSDGEKIFSAIEAGAIGYLVKDSSPNELVLAVRNASNGIPVMTQKTELSLIHQIQRKPVLDFSEESITERELGILRWLALGLTNAQIAEKGCISEGTVRSHVSNLLGKLCLENRAQAVIYALNRGLIEIGSK